MVSTVLGGFLALGLAGCSADGTTRACRTDDECAGSACVSGRCVAPCTGAGCVDAGSDGASPDAPLADGGCVVRCGPSATCCGANEVCEFGLCLPECSGSRCANDTVCCEGSELCVGNRCVQPGAMCADELDCAMEETCEPLVGRCVPVPPGAECQFRPPVGMFSPELQWEFTGRASVVPPVVVSLTDDNGDGQIDARDVPDVVVNMIDGLTAIGPATLMAFSGDDGRVLWESSENVAGLVSHAAADLDGDGTVEIVITDAQNRLAIFSHTGTLERTGAPTSAGGGLGGLAIADLQADGTPEIVAGVSVHRNDGSLAWSGTQLGPLPSLADLDLDGELEVAGSSAAYNADGSLLWSGGAVANGYTAIARVLDVPSSAGPQVVAVNARTLQILDGASGTSLFGPITFESGAASLAGPPTVADFDGDGKPEIGIAGDSAYVVIDPERPPPHVSWTVPSEDVTTGSVGSTVFDFDADGSAEVVYADECHVRILSGMDGSVLWSTGHKSGTGIEYPVVADVDADGNAELIVVSNEQVFDARCGDRTLPWAELPPGVRVYRDTLDNWVPTRSIWNQHTYHIDNVRDDGSLPRPETRSWESHNTFRLNAFLDPEAATRAPDLVVSAHSARANGCPARAILRARVENRGSRGVPAGVRVAFFAGEPPDRTTLLGVGQTAAVILAGAGEWVEIEVTSLPLDAESMLRFYAVVDEDGMGASQHSECREDNNEGEPIAFSCRGPT
ncbi:MAG: FG-GAP-like repeat-containing protein [Myxococcota bacterium]